MELYLFMEVLKDITLMVTCSRMGLVSWHNGQGYRNLILVLIVVYIFLMIKFLLLSSFLKLRKMFMIPSPFHLYYNIFGGRQVQFPKTHIFIAILPKGDWKELSPKKHPWLWSDRPCWSGPEAEPKWTVPGRSDCECAHTLPPDCSKARSGQLMMDAQFHGREWS